MQTEEVVKAVATTIVKNNRKIEQVFEKQSLYTLVMVLFFFYMASLAGCPFRC